MDGVLARAERGDALGDAEALSLAAVEDLPALMEVAARLRDRGHGQVVSYSRKVFIPLTQLCRDSCGYCTFAHPPRRNRPAYLDPEAVLEIARRGAAAGCHEALFTLGDKPELKWAAAADALKALGHDTTLSYLAAMAKRVVEETGLLPHLNPGVMTAEDIARLRPVSISQGIMLESAAERLGRRGGAHYGAPDKAPALRLATIRAAGEQRVPFTSGILIGIGETRRERIEALLALRQLHAEHGHLQEIIVQNFRAKPGTRMAGHREPGRDDMLWTIAVARLIFGAAMNIQAPPNLSPADYPVLLDAGINDWGGISPVTPDHVNPEAPWPEVAALERAVAAAGKVLVPRLAAYPDYALDADRWIDPGLAPRVRRAVDASGFVFEGAWHPGMSADLPAAQIQELAAPALRAAGSLAPAIDRAVAGRRLDATEVTALFAARGDALVAVAQAADALRRETAGDAVTYVVNRNINYTNICYFRCTFCAFSKGKTSESLRGKPYAIDTDEIVRRAQEAWDRGATEVCLQGGIHPEYTGETYLGIARALKAALPDLHVHAFSPLEVWQGAATLGLPVAEFLARLKEAGLGTLPGTAAEILDDEIRQVICPDKITTGEWLSVMRAAHGVGLRSTATIMFGHVDRPLHWARHLLRIRDLQAETGGFTEFVPLPFVHMEAPVYYKGRARKGPSFREAVLMHAVARLALHPLIPSIQTSWVKMGPEGAAACLRAGANDLGGTLMNETITRSAGAQHGQEFGPEAMDALIRSIGRAPVQRTTLYGEVPAARQSASYGAPELLPLAATAAA